MQIMTKSSYLLTNTELAVSDSRTLKSANHKIWYVYLTSYIRFSTIKFIQMYWALDWEQT